MIERKANTYRLYPTDEQRLFLAQTAGACRFVYNLALDQRQHWGKRYKERVGKALSYTAQSRELTALKKECAWLAHTPSQPLQQALRDLDTAYQNFFSGRSGYPSPRKKGKNDRFRFPIALPVERTSKTTGRIKLPKLGWVTFRGWYALPQKIRNVTVSLRAGQWYAAVQWERETREPPPRVHAPVGVDMGVAVFASLSNGDTLSSQNFGKKALGKLARAQRALARKKKGSANRRKALHKLRTLHHHVLNARKDFLHKASTTLAKNHGIVVMEELKTASMSASAKGTSDTPGKNVKAKSGLNRSILDQGWHMFKTFLGYKLADRGGHLALVHPAYTSQICSCCGHKDAQSRRSQERFVCTACGHAENADINAAKNILRRWGTPLKPVEERALAPL